MSLLALLAAHAAPDPPYDPGEDTTPYAFPTTSPYNVPVPAITPTYDGSGQGIHPSVIDFQTQHELPAWNGYRYWMGMTPYTASAIAVENPSILASHDGYTWVVPPGMDNPIEGFNVDGGGYNSDTELVYDPSTGRLVCYWRRAVSSPNDEEIRAAWSNDGTTWTKVGTLVTATGGTTNTRILSPAITRLGPSSWVMVTIGTGEHTPTIRTATSPLGPWSAAAAVTFTYVSGTAPAAPWHFGMVNVGGVLYGLIDHSGNKGLTCATSTDGATWNVNGTERVVGRVGQWDMIPYRATLTPHEDGESFRVWYSANDDAVPPATDWRTGYTLIPRSAWPAPPA